MSKAKTIFIADPIAFTGKGEEQAIAFIKKTKGVNFVNFSKRDNLSDLLDEYKPQEGRINVIYAPKLSDQDVVKFSKTHQIDGYIAAARPSKDVKTRFFARMGAGVNNKPADPNCITMNTPGGNTQASVNGIMAMLAELEGQGHEEMRNIHQMTVEGKLFSNDLSPIYRAKWGRGVGDKKLPGDGLNLKGRKAAVIGGGHIGSGVARGLLKCGAEVSVWSRSLSKQDAVVIEELQALYGGRLTVVTDPKDPKLAVSKAMKDANIVSINLAQNEHTIGLIGKEQINALADGATFINTARGPVVNTQELIKAKKSGKVGKIGVDLDLFQDKNEKQGSHAEPFLVLAKEKKGVLVLPHVIADCVEQGSRTDCFQQAFTEIVDAIQNKKITNLAVDTKLPKDFENLGVKKPKGVSTLMEDVARLKRVKDLAKEIKKLKKETVKKPTAPKNKKLGPGPTPPRKLTKQEYEAFEKFMVDEVFKSKEGIAIMRKLSEKHGKDFYAELVEELTGRLHRADAATNIITSLLDLVHEIYGVKIKFEGEPLLRAFNEQFAKELKDQNKYISIKKLKGIFNIQNNDLEVAKQLGELLYGDLATQRLIWLNDGDVQKAKENRTQLTNEQASQYEQAFLNKFTAKIRAVRAAMRGIVIGDAGGHGGFLTGVENLLVASHMHEGKEIKGRKVYVISNGAFGDNWSNNLKNMFDAYGLEVEVIKAPEGQMPSEKQLKKIGLKDDVVIIGNETGTGVSMPQEVKEFLKKRVDLQKDIPVKERGLNLADMTSYLGTEKPMKGVSWFAPPQKTMGGRPNFCFMYLDEVARYRTTIHKNWAINSAFCLSEVGSDGKNRFRTGLATGEKIARSQLVLDHLDCLQQLFVLKDRAQKKDQTPLEYSIELTKKGSEYLQTALKQRAAGILDLLTEDKKYQGHFNLVTVCKDANFKSYLEGTNIGLETRDFSHLLIGLAEDDLLYDVKPFPGSQRKDLYSRTTTINIDSQDEANKIVDCLVYGAKKMIEYGLAMVLEQERLSLKAQKAEYVIANDNEKVGDELTSAKIGEDKLHSKL